MKRPWDGVGGGGGGNSRKKYGRSALASFNFRQTDKGGKLRRGGKRRKSKPYQRLAINALARDMCPSWVYNADKFMNPVYTGNNIVNGTTLGDFSASAGAWGIQAFDYREYLTQQDIMNYLFQSLNIAARGGSLDFHNPGYQQLATLLSQVGGSSTNVDLSNAFAGTIQNTFKPYDWGAIFNTSSSAETYSQNSMWKLMRYNFACERYDIIETYTNQTTNTAYITVSEWVQKRANPRGATSAATRATQISGTLSGGYTTDGFNLFNAWIADLRDTRANTGHILKARADTIVVGAADAGAVAAGFTGQLVSGELPTLDDTLDSNARHNATFSEIEDMVFKPGYHPSPKGKCVGTFYKRIAKKRIVLKPGETYKHVDSVGGFKVNMGTDIMFYDKLLYKTRIHCVSAYGEMGVESSALLAAGTAGGNYIGDRMAYGPIKLNRKCEVKARFRLLPFTAPTQVVRDGLFGFTDWQDISKTEVNERTALPLNAVFGAYSEANDRIQVTMEGTNVGTDMKEGGISRL